MRPPIGRSVFAEPRFDLRRFSAPPPGLDVFEAEGKGWVGWGGLGWVGHPYVNQHLRTIVLAVKSPYSRVSQPHQHCNFPGAVRTVDQCSLIPFLSSCGTSLSFALSAALQCLRVSRMLSAPPALHPDWPAVAFEGDHRADLKRCVDA